MKQNEAVLALLRERGDGGITALEALHAVGTFRLAARIADLRAEGHDIRTEMVAIGDKHVAVYTIVEKPRQLTAFA